MRRFIRRLVQIVYLRPYVMTGATPEKSIEASDLAADEVREHVSRMHNAANVSNLDVNCRIVTQIRISCSIYSQAVYRFILRFQRWMLRDTG